MFDSSIQQSLVGQLMAYQDPQAAKALTEFALHPESIKVYPVNVCVRGPFLNLLETLTLQNSINPTPLLCKYFAGEAYFLNATGTITAAYTTTDGAAIQTLRSTTTQNTIRIYNALFNVLSMPVPTGHVILNGIIVAGNY